MSTDEYVPSEVIPALTDEQVREHWVESMARAVPRTREAIETTYDSWLAAHDARVRRDAALTLAEHFSAEAIDQAHRGNPDGVDFYRAVATEIENQIPEETP